MVTTTAPDGSPRTLVLFGVPFHDVTFAETVAWCEARMRLGTPSCLATANVDFLMQATHDPELRRILLEADLVVADGMPIVWASRRMGPPLRERVTGSDLVPLLAAACARGGFRLFLLGGAPGVAERAAEVLVARHRGLIIAGTYSPPQADLLQMDHAAILERLHAARPHLLLVAFGAPKQEKFINLHLRQWAVPLAIGVGGTLDFLAGAQTRAPRWVQGLGFEWLWRLGTNPRRLFKRYAGNLAFLAGALARRRRLRRALVDATPGDTLPASGAAATGRRFVTRDLGTREWLDSAELGRLVREALALRRRGGRLLLGGGGDRLALLLREEGLLDYLDYCPTPLDLARRRGELEDVAREGAVRREGRGFVLYLPAELTVETLPVWRERVEAAWQAKPPDEVGVDGAGLDFIDSAALGWLIALRKRCQDDALPCRFTNFSGSARQTIRLARLEALLLEDR